MAGTLVGVLGITLLAYSIKAATGFGPALVVVALGSVLLGPLNAVVLAAFLDLASGVGMMWLDRGKRRGHGWIGFAVVMSVGAAMGGVLLEHIPTSALTVLVGAGVLALGLWMVATAMVGGKADTAAQSGMSSRPAVGSYAVVAGAGISGGLIGVGGPPLVIYFSSRLGKADFRALIVPILLAAAVTRVATYVLTGQVGSHILLWVAISLPVLPLGLIIGDRIFRRWSESSFRLAVALLVVVAGVRLLSSE